MAPDVTVEIKHAVYDTYSHQHGPNLTVDPGHLETLLSQGDAALDRSAGRFFEVIDGRLVIVFSDNRSEGTKGRMRYFDVFTLPVESIAGGLIDQLVKGLEDYRVAQYGDEPVSPVSVTLPKKPDQNSRDQSGHEANSNVNEGAESSTHDSENIPEDTTVDHDADPSEQDPVHSQHEEPTQSDIDERFIAEIWEQIRRDTTQCEATLEEVAEFFTLVNGALEETSFVSRCREDVEYFDISGSNELAMETNPEAMVELITNLTADGNLNYDALPTYREELEEKREQEQKAIRNDERISKTTKTVVWAFANKIESELEEYPELAAHLMQEVEEGSLSEGENDDGGLKSRFSGLMGNDKEETETELIDPADYPEIDDEVITSVDSKLDEKREQIIRELKEQLLIDLRDQLVNEINNQAERVADDSMSAIQDTRTSELHERAKDGESEY